MNNENTPITEFDLSLIADFFNKLGQQGPGGEAETLRALEFVPIKPGLRIADIGSGTGRQTQTIASCRDCSVTAVDLMPEMIEVLNERMKNAGLGEKVTGIVASMADLPFEEESFDVIWCEGAIYNVGFEEGLSLWRKFLKPGGWIVVTDCSWLTNARPENPQYILENFPDIGEIPQKVGILQKAGYMPVAHFTLPEQCWTENYYAQMGTEIPKFRARHADSAEAQTFIRMMQEDIDHYRENKAFFGYVFYIGQKIG